MTCLIVLCPAYFTAGWPAVGRGGTPGRPDRMAARGPERRQPRFLGRDGRRQPRKVDAFEGDQASDRKDHAVHCARDTASARTFSAAVSASAYAWMIRPSGQVRNLVVGPEHRARLQRKGQLLAKGDVHLHCRQRAVVQRTANRTCDCSHASDHPRGRTRIQRRRLL